MVHLAGHPDEASLPESLVSHVHTTAALLDAMVAHGVTRFVYASSNHAVGMTPRCDRVGVDVRPRPDTFYGVGKVAAEAVMSLYADRHGLDAVSCRIGSFLERPQVRRNLATWLSHDDCVRMVQAALIAESPGFAVLYGISANTGAWWDLEAGRRLGYEPQDDAEAWAAELAERPEDEAEAARVGGPFAGRSSPGGRSDDLQKPDKSDDTLRMVEAPAPSAARSRRHEGDPPCDVPRCAPLPPPWS